MNLTNTLQRCALLLLTLIFCSTLSIAQEAPKEDHTYKPLKLNLSEDGKKFVRLIMWHQIWLTSNNLSADDAKLQVTPSIRRSRFLALAQVSPKFLIITHFGLNGLTPSTLTSLGSNGNGPQFFLHDAWGEYRLHKSLYVGGGLHYWKGMTRLSNASTLNFMTLDQARPFTSWHALGVTNQFARHLGVYAKGAIGKFDYRVAVNSPLRATLGDGIDWGNKTAGWTYQGVQTPDSNGDPTGNMVVEGYFRYNFWDTESTKLPFQVGTYLGKKKVFGIGAGFFTHPNGMYNTVTGEHSNVSHFALDAYLDMPMGESGALNAYVSYMNFNYGENYVSRWAGTGNNIYGQLGYLIDGTKFMPYVAYQTGNYDGFEDPVSSLNAGVNYFINGHHAKVTLEYHSIVGDVREGAIATQADAISQIRMQLHFFL